MSSYEQLMAMGFSSDSVTTALQMNNNNFENALSLLLNQSSMVTNSASSSSPQPIATNLNDNSLNNFSSNSNNPYLESLAQSLSKDQKALDAINGILEKLIINPSDSRVTVLQLGGSLAPIKNSENAINLLKELGYESRSGFLMLKTIPKNLQETKLCLLQAKGTEDYRIASLLESSKNEALEEAKNQRELLRKKPARPEPDPSNTFTRLFFHFNKDGEPESESKQIERRFEPDECLYDVIHYLGTLDESILESHSWELIENASSSSTSPYWWCHGWNLSDITLRPSRIIKKEDASKTLQGLGLWPSAHIRITVSGLAPSLTPSGNKGANSNSIPVTEFRSGGRENYVRSRPTPQQVMKQATARFESIPLNGKEHANVNRSAAATRAAAAEARMNQIPNNTKPLPNTTTNQSQPSLTSTSASIDGTVAELVAMGFPENKVKDALKSSQGNQERAVEILLR
mmetsp:Transcript_25979/g.30759  ORF Transcript_25979/g.30759 Transcript_25979/m.30759 type:complete len:460 (+) Transcript_25979:62-1441(+)|eukprot:CAMPEP_0114341488 /NCGR_PEP_ID=MMETSP0101-20121206/9083_1 /TAXON_ID=38822 ORGANISM="Pteridomonas danica, Strain PT" /NCGR_SAMPLE_ID=MMETSP0101 /ASSEMBLY_ACC=CAM_ASM_000211 /LENGTH=459 /DNA_ID=CAMNT_0001475113 /DNA_START=55 /DNA_END=1434 /DNA_ORIENTATION=+